MEPAKVPQLCPNFSENEVYQPSDDTFLFLDALKMEFSKAENANLHLALEIGCGSGAMITYLGQLLKDKNILCMATDLNPMAVTCTMETAKLNHVHALEVIRTDIVQGLEDRLQGCVDVLLFNPPYVPTDPEEVGSTSIEAAWAGGLFGRQVIDRVLPKVGMLLSKTGVFYMVTVEENKPKEIGKMMRDYGFSMETIRKKKAYNERLAIQKFKRIV